MRCLTLAGALREAGVASHFFCRAHDGHMAELIRGRGCNVTLMPVDSAFARRDDYDGWRGGSLDEDIRLTHEAVVASGGADILLVDHYGLDERFETALRPLFRAIAVMDDLHEVRHDCDILINQNIGDEPKLYVGLVPPGARLFVGPDFAQLRLEFAQCRSASLARRRAIDAPAKLLVTAGGADQDNVTARALEALDPASGMGLSWVEHAHVVLTCSSRHLEEVRCLAARLPNVTLHVDTLDMPNLMSECDIAIGGSGVTSIERCVLGLPCVIVVMAENQVSLARRLEAAGAARSLGWAKEVTAAKLASMLNQIRREPGLVQSMSESAAALCDGQGLNRVAPELLALLPA